MNDQFEGVDEQTVREIWQVALTLSDAQHAREHGWKA